MASLTNASSSKKGFNYQDYVAEGYLFRDVKELDKINDEGRDDVDLFYSDGNIYYLQAKETTPAWKYNSSELENGLRELITKLHTDTPNRIFYVTNSYYPLGKKARDCDFSGPYQKYDYTNLSPTTKNIIKKQIHNISKITDKKGDYKYKYIHDLYVNHSNDLDNVLAPLSIVKFKYDGSDPESKLSQVRYYIRKFLHNAYLDGASADDVLRDMAFVINQSSEDKSKCVTKRHLISEVFVTTSSEDALSHKFFQYCVLFDDHLTDKAKRDKLKSMFLDRYDCISSIYSMFLSYYRDTKKQLNGNIDKFKILKNFVIGEEPYLAKMLDLNSNTGFKSFSRDALKESVEYIAWMIVVCHGKLKFIKKAANYENN